MAKLNRHQLKPAKSREERPQSRWRWWMMTVGVTIALGAVLFVVSRAARTNPPVISLTGLDRAIKNALEQASAEVRSSPRSGESWGKLAMTLQTVGFKSEARQCYTQAERLAPANPRWPYLHGLLLLDVQPEVALMRLRRAAELSGDKPDAPRLRLAEALAERGRLENAVAEFNAMLRTQTNHPAALLGLAKVANARGRLEESRGFLQRCAKDSRTAHGAQVLLASVERGLGNPAAAEAAAHAAANLPPDPDWPDPFLAELAARRPGHLPLLERGQQLLQQGRLADALPLFTRAVQKHPDDADSWLWLGRARLEQKDGKGAEQALRRHLQLMPASVNGHYQLGFALLGLERHADAAVEFGRAVGLRPDFGEAHCVLGFALAKAGRRAEAIASLRAAIRYSPEFVESYLTLAELMSQAEEKEEAFKLLGRALQLDPTEGRAKVLLEKLESER